MSSNKKMMRIILIALIVCVILVIVLMAVMIFMQPEKETASFRFFINGEIIENQEDLFIFEPNQIYVSIKDISRLLEVGFYSGAYLPEQGNEDKDKCYIMNEYEVCSFYQDSDRIYKKRLDEESDWEYYDILVEVQNINGKLYVSLEGMCTAFNVSGAYNIIDNYITVYTLDYLYNYYHERAADYGIDRLASEYDNKQALLRSMLVGIKDNKFGVLHVDGDTIVGYKYDKLLYKESTKEFLATIGDSVGVLSETGQTKITIKYDNVKLIDRNLRLWLVETNGIYGVLDKNGMIVIYQEYEKIGVDTTKFPPDKTHNGIILYDNAIPFCRDGKWGIYNKEGHQIVAAEYDEIGCVVNNSKTAIDGNLLTIPEVNGIIVCKNGLYGLVDEQGNSLITCMYEKIYRITNMGTIEYYVENNGESTKIDIKSKVKI